MLDHGKLIVQVTTGDPVSTDPWALAASRSGLECGVAPRMGCTVTSAYGTTPANGAWCSPRAAPGSPVLVFSPFAFRNAPNPLNTTLVNSTVEVAAVPAASVANASCPADRDSLMSDHSAFDARHGDVVTGRPGHQVRLACSAAHHHHAESPVVTLDCGLHDSAGFMGCQPIYLLSVSTRPCSCIGLVLGVRLGEGSGVPGRCTCRW